MSTKPTQKPSPPKKAPGRPRIGEYPMTAAERKRRSLAQLIKNGGSTLSISLSPDETTALRLGMKKKGITVKREYVVGLIAKER